MPWLPWSLGSRFRSWLHDYDRIQSFAVVLLYIQIGCSLIGSLGALYNGVLLINLAAALFALVAIESSSQSLGRTYAVLLGCSIFLDVAWFILFSSAIWNISSEEHETFFIFSLRLMLTMQILGSSVRFLSSFLWIRMYRLGASSVDTVYHEADYDLRNSFLNTPSHEIRRQTSNSDEILGGSIYDPTYYSSLFEDTQDKSPSNEGGARAIGRVSSGPTANTSQLRASLGSSFQIVDVDRNARPHRTTGRTSSS